MLTGPAVPGAVGPNFFVVDVDGRKLILSAVKCKLKQGQSIDKLPELGPLHSRFPHRERWPARKWPDPASLRAASNNCEVSRQSDNGQAG
jgi:hypothetical protein